MLKKIITIILNKKFIIFFFNFHLFFFLGCSNHNIKKSYNLNNNINLVNSYISKIVFLNIFIKKNKTTIGAELWLTKNIKKYTSTIILVPGSGEVSRRNSQEGDGVNKYTTVIDLNFLLADILCKEGFNVFLFDKRTCFLSRDISCNINYLKINKNIDFDDLILDFDSVCEFLFSYLNENQKNKLIFFGFNQSTHVILNSKYKNYMSSIIIISPVVEKIDKVIVEGILENSFLSKSKNMKYKMYNKSETVNSIFNAIKSGNFFLNSIIMGVTIEFWKKWFYESSKSFELLNNLKIPSLFILGSDNKVLDKNSKNKIFKLNLNNKNKILFLNNVDHNLLTNEKLLYRNIFYIMRQYLEFFFNSY